MRRNLLIIIVVVMLLGIGIFMPEASKDSAVTNTQGTEEAESNPQKPNLYDVTKVIDGVFNSHGGRLDRAYRESKYS